MISSIFGKTKPINHLIVLAFLFVFYWLVHFFLLNATFSLTELLSKAIVLSILLFSIFIVDFIIKRNKMTNPNSFAILFYGLLMVVFPETLADDKAVLCSFFLILATRRLISIRSLKGIKLKIFDATLWVMASSVFYDWALVYILLVFVAIYMYEPKNIRNWIVPLVAILTFFAIGYALLILTDDKEFITRHYQFTFDFNIAYFLNWGDSSKLMVYVVLTLFAIVYSFLKLGKSGLGKIVTMRLVVLSFIIGIGLKIVVSSEDMDPIMVTFFPAVIFMTNYIEAIKKPKIKEAVLLATIVVPILIFVSSSVIK